MNLKSITMVDHVKIKSGFKHALFLHGLFGNPQEFIQVVPDSIGAIGVKIPGHNTAVDRDFPTYCHDLLKFIKKNHFEFIYGYSMGGRILLECLKTEHVNCPVFLESTGPGAVCFGEEIEFNQQIRQLQDKDFASKIANINNRKDFLSEWYENPLFFGHKIQDSQLQHFEGLNLKDLSQAVIEFSSGNQSNIFDEKDFDFSNIHFLFGSEDKKYAAFAKDYAKRGALVHEFHGIGHNIHSNQPEKVKAILKRELEKNLL